MVRFFFFSFPFGVGRIADGANCLLTFIRSVRGSPGKAFGFGQSGQQSQAGHRHYFSREGFGALFFFFFLLSSVFYVDRGTELTTRFSFCVRVLFFPSDFEQVPRRGCEEGGAGQEQQGRARGASEGRRGSRRKGQCPGKSPPSLTLHAGP